MGGGGGWGEERMGGERMGWDVTSKGGGTCNLDNRMQEFDVESRTVRTPHHALVAYEQIKNRCRI